MTALANQLLQTAPGALPVVGHLPQFLHDRLGVLSRCGASDAAVVRLRLDGDAYLLLDAMDIKHVLETNHPNYDKSPRMTSPRGKQLSGYGLLTSSGKEHLERRKTLQPVFAASSIEPLTHAIAQETDRFLSTLGDGQEIDAATVLMDLAQCINGRILFSAEYHGADKELGEAIRIRRKFMTQVFNSVLPLPEYLPTRLRGEFKKAQQFISNEVKSRIQQRRKRPEMFGDMLGRLVSVTDDQSANEEAVTTAITGYETIGEALAWTCMLLGQHPRVEKKLAKDPQDLSYAEMIINESMRLYPPTWIYVRIGREADRLPSGVDLPAGARVYLCPWVIHRSARYWNDPLKFDPDRFEEENRKSRPKYAWFPFGGGPRICIGQALAKLEMPLVLSMIMQRYSLELLPGQNITPDPKITLRPNPAIRMKIKAR